MKKVKRIVTHGAAGYFAGCRCKTCRYAGSKYFRDRRIKLQAQRDRALEQQAA